MDVFIVGDRVRCFVVTGSHNGMLCVRQRCGRRRQRCCIWAVAGRENVQHADSDTGWRLGDSDLNLNPKTQTHRCVQLSDRDSA